MSIRNVLEGTTPLVEWQLVRHNQHVMCAVRATGKAFDVVVLPMWDVATGAIETCATAAEALRRHAAIASDLRAAGWAIAAYTASSDEPIAA